MTYDRRPGDPADAVDPVDDGTRVVERQTYVEQERPVERQVERQTYVEQERPVDPGYVPPQATSNVNVQPSSGGGGYVTATPGPLFYARRVVSLLFGVFAVLIGLRILLLLLVANEGNAIVDFIYNVTEPFVAPFRGIFSFDVVRAGDAALDIGAIVALIGWLLIYLLIMAILRLGDRNTTAA